MIMTTGLGLLLMCLGSVSSCDAIMERCNNVPCQLHIFDRSIYSLDLLHSLLC